MDNFDEFVYEASQLFADNFEKLIRRSVISNIPQLVWEDRIEVTFLRRDEYKNPVPLNKDMVSTYFMIDEIGVLEDGRKVLGEVEAGEVSSELLDRSGGPWLFIHEVATGHNGITTLDRVKDLFRNYGEKYELGYYHWGNGRVYRNFFITNDKGELLLGRAQLNPETKDVDILTSEQYDQLVSQHTREIRKGLYTLIDSYRSIVFSTGTLDTALFQKAVVSCVQTDENRRMFPGEEKVKSALLKKQLVRDIPYAVNPDRYLVDGFREGVEAFSAIYYQFEHRDQYGLAPRIGARNLWVPPEFYSVYSHYKYNLII